ncbi:hypothetical protein NPIL_54411 [Nephila pilipes]|uniref:Uncharacterized protein n=1 Tax=Nephila pilipes TaxID=299642 RepID=A0A8X6JR86_NEPPI|nr:hypothetical protein NPIL_54411 [Nephila pilipes]
MKNPRLIPSRSTRWCAEPRAHWTHWRSKFTIKVRKYFCLPLRMTKEGQLLHELQIRYQRIYAIAYIVCGQQSKSNSLSDFLSSGVVMPYGNAHRRFFSKHVEENSIG